MNSHPGTDKIASATRLLISSGPSVVRFERVRGRQSAPVAGDQGFAVAAGHMAVTRFAGHASAPLDPTKLSIFG